MATSSASREIEGLNLRQDIAQGYLTSNVLAVPIAITNPAVYATIAIGAEASDVRGITITLLNAKGKAINYAQILDVVVYSSTAGTALATGGSTGIAAGGGSGIVISTLTAKKHFICQTSTAGVLTLTWTDTGTESVALGIILPNRVRIMSAAFANT